MPSEAFALRGVVHLIRPWGTPARDLEQLLRGIASAPDSVLFRHAVQHQLRHPAAEELPPDDLSAWIAGVIQDSQTAERLRFEVQSSAAEPGVLRERLLAVLESVPATERVARDAPEDSPFLFLSATSADFPIGEWVHDASESVDALITADACVWFFHLIEQPFFSRGHSPLLTWLEQAGQGRLASWLAAAACAGMPIDRARARLHARWRRSGIGRRLAEASAQPESARREAGRQTVARWVRRARGRRDA